MAIIIPLLIMVVREEPLEKAARQWPANILAAIMAAAVAAVAAVMAQAAAVAAAGRAMVIVLALAQEVEADML